MAFNIEDIRTALSLGGARPTLFNVVITPPPGGVPGAVDAILKIPFLCSASAIPASTLGTVLVPYFGRKIKLAGDRTYAEWIVTVLNDEDFLIRDFFETWSNQINSAQGNLLEFSSADPSLYEGIGLVTQFGKIGNPVRIYQMNDIWPNVVGPITVGWDNNDIIETYNVTFQYDFWNIAGGITGDAGGV